MTDDDVQARFDWCIALLAGVQDESVPFTLDSRGTGALAAACSAAHALIGDLAPGDKTFRAQFDALLKDNQKGLAKPSVCRGLLQAAKGHFEGGFDKLRSAAAADTFTDLLDMAQYLYDGGYRLAATALCGAVLEDALKRIHEDRIGPWGGAGDPSIQKYNEALYALYRGDTFPEYDNTQQKNVVGWGGLRNDADHGLRSNSEALPFLDKDGNPLPAIDPAKVEAMITGVRSFIARFRP